LEWMRSWEEPRWYLPTTMLMMRSSH
jgi:hypothetical protein